MEKKQLLKLTNDYVFKRTFGYAGDEEVTKVFLEDILEEEISKITLDNNTITEKELFTDKVGVMDVKAYLNDGCPCDIEMQVVEQSDIEKRILFYWAKCFTKTIEAGNAYDSMKKTIVVLIADFELDILTKIPKYHTKWHVREDEYKTCVLTDVLELFIIELPKVEKYMNKEKKKKLNLWVNFIKNPEVFDMKKMENSEELIKTKKAIKKAKEKIDKISQDEHERYLAELREKYIRDQKSIQKYGYECGLKEGRESGLKEGHESGLKEGHESGLKEGRESGLKEGHESGFKDGAKKEKLKIAKTLLEKGFKVDVISESTGLSIEELKKLQ